jgi:transposase
MTTARKPYPSDVTDAEWAFLAPDLTLMREDAPQREIPLRLLFNAIRYVVKTRRQWRYLLHEFPPWTAGDQQARRWLAAGVCESIVHDLRVILRVFVRRDGQPSAATLDARTMQSTPESGGWAGFDGHKKKNGSKALIAVDTMGNLLAIHVTAANEQERSVVGELAERALKATGVSIRVAFADQGYTGEAAEEAAAEHGVDLIVVKHPEVKHGFVLLPRRWVVERTFGWLGRFRRLARDYERLEKTLAGWRRLAFISLMFGKLIFQSA